MVISTKVSFTRNPLSICRFTDIHKTMLSYQIGEDRWDTNARWTFMTYTPDFLHIWETHDPQH